MNNELENWARDAKFVVTGGVGFIGSHLVSALVKSGARVSVVDDLSAGDPSSLPSGAELWVADVCDVGVMRRVLRGADGCFHLAAVASVEACQTNPARARRVNQAGTNSILRHASQLGNIPVVWASSAAVYGRQADMPVPECARLDPISAYGEDKYANEKSAVTAARLWGLPNTAMRVFNVYGPGQSSRSNPSGVIARFIDYLTVDSPLFIFGDGRNVRDFIHVSDVVQAFLNSMYLLHAKRAPRFTAINVCNGHGVNILELASSIAAIMKKNPEVVFTGPREGDIVYSVGNSEMLDKIVPRSGRTELMAGLCTLVAQRGSGGAINTRALGSSKNSL